MPGPLGQVNHGEPPFACQLGYAGDEGPILIRERTILLGVREPDFLRDVRAYEYVHGGVMRSAGIEGEAEVSEGIGSVEPTEDEYSACLNRYLVQFRQVSWLPTIIGVKPRDPLCVDLGEECSPSPSSATTLRIASHYDRSRYQLLCHDTCQSRLEAALAPESRWVCRDGNSNTWA